MEKTNRQLMWHGMFLFLLGLVTGLLEQRFTNKRMGVAAHYETVGVPGLKGYWRLNSPQQKNSMLFSRVATRTRWQDWAIG
jgi:hypothetical protein